MKIPLPASLKAQVDGQVAGRGFGTSNESVRQLIRKDQDRQNLRALLVDGAGSAPAEPADEAYSDTLRGRVRHSDWG